MATVNKFKCSDCSKRFETAQSLGLHRRNVHNVGGQSRSAIVKRMLENPQPTENPAPNQCRHCGFEALNLQGLNLHVNTYHSEKPQPKKREIAASVREARAKIYGGEYPCPHCDFVAQWTGGLKIHIRAAHKEGSTIERQEKTAAVSTIEVRAEKTHAAANGYAISDATLALALGRFQGLCQSMAVEFDLPPRLFAARLAELIYHSQVR